MDDETPLGFCELVHLIANTLAEHPDTIDVHGGPSFGSVEVRTDLGTFRVQVSEVPE